MSNEKHPKFSIVVPMYNNANRLKQGLDSIVTQSYENWECIVVNNNLDPKDPKQADEFNTAFKQFKDSIRLFYPKEAESIIKKIHVIDMDKCRVNKARETGIQKADEHSDFTMFMDGDDRLHRDALKNAAAALKEKGMTVENTSIITQGQVYLDLKGVYGGKYENVDDYIKNKETKPPKVHDNGINYLQTEYFKGETKSGITRYLLNTKEYKDKFKQPVFTYEDAASTPGNILRAENAILETDDVNYIYCQNENSMTQIAGVDQDIKRQEDTLEALKYGNDDIPEAIEYMKEHCESFKKLGEETQNKQIQKLRGTIKEQIDHYHKITNEKLHGFEVQKMKEEKEQTLDDLTQAYNTQPKATFEQLMSEAIKKYQEHGYTPEFEAKFRAHLASIPPPTQQKQFAFMDQNAPEREQ